MAWIIITVIAVLVAGFGLVVGITSPTDRKWGLALTGGVGVVWIVVTGVFSIALIGQRQVGIVYNFSGTITGQKSSGTVVIAPWQHIQTENIGVQREDFVLDQSNAAVSSDQQAIYADLSLNYRVDPQHVLNLYKTVGPSWKAILLDSRVLQDFKEITSKFTAEQITTQREQLRADTKARLSSELAKYDVTVVDFFVKNLSYTQSYQDSINAKNVQVQKALQAQAKVAQAKAEAEQQVARAAGQAKANLLIAEAQAKSLEVKGKALRDNPQILQLEAIDKLAPNASVIICTGSTCPAFLPQAATVKPGGTTAKP